MDTTPIIKGLLVGLAAGAVGTLAKTVWEDHFPVRDEQTDSPPAKIAQRTTDATLSSDQKEQAETAMHWTFGTTAGGIYGTVVELAPEASTGFGLLFGLSLYAVTHATTLPAADLEPAPDDAKPEYALNEFMGHLVYAGVVELMRRGLRSVV